jgi:hypothetical protein
MGIFVLTNTYELRVSRKSHLRDHPNCNHVSQTQTVGATNSKKLWLLQISFFALEYWF